MPLILLVFGVLFFWLMGQIARSQQEYYRTYLWLPVAQQQRSRGPSWVWIVVIPAVVVVGIIWLLEAAEMWRYGF